MKIHKNHLMDDYRNENLNVYEYIQNRIVTKYNKSRINVTANIDSVFLFPQFYFPNFGNNHQYKKCDNNITPYLGMRVSFELGVQLGRLILKRRLLYWNRFWLQFFRLLLQFFHLFSPELLYYFLRFELELLRLSLNLFISRKTLLYLVYLNCFPLRRWPRLYKNYRPTCRTVPQLSRPYGRGDPRYLRSVRMPHLGGLNSYRPF